MTELKRRKVSKKQINAEKDMYGRRSKKTLECKVCLEPVHGLSSDVGSVTCAQCVAYRIAPPDSIVKAQAAAEAKAAGRPRGWHLRANFTDDNGVMFSFGKEVTENADISSATTDVVGRVDRNNKRSTKRAVKKKVAKRKK